MKTVNQHGMNLIVLMLLSSAIALLAQSPESKALKFALAIEEKPLEAENTPGTHILLVKYTNLSDKVQWDPCVVSPWEYKLAVLRDGTQVEKKYAYRKKTEEHLPPGAIKLELDERKVCSATDRLNPGQSVKFSLWVTSNYDMTVPGTYEITVTRETDPWNPEKNVTIKSNTLTIVVPEPGASAPQ
jgi:hypothetical protein